MAYPALFYNAVNGDRVYDADSFERWLKKFFTSGVFAGDLPVTANDSMTVSVGTGYANTDGKVVFFDEETQLDIAVAHATLRRVDNIVVERSDTDRDITLKVVTGTPAASPQAPAVVRENGIYQLVIAQVTLPAGATSVTSAMIRDTRVPAEGEDPVLCGIVGSAVDSLDITQLYALWQQQFDDWFATVQDTLDGDTAGHLENQIIGLDGRVSAIEERGSADVLDIKVKTADWSSDGQPWPDGGNPLGMSSASTCYVAVIRTLSDGETAIPCADGDGFKPSEYSRAKCPAPLWIYIGDGCVYVATTTPPTSEITIRGLILHR